MRSTVPSSCHEANYQYTVGHGEKSFGSCPWALGRGSEVAGSDLWGVFEAPVGARIAGLRWCPSWIPSRALISLVILTPGAGWLGSRVGCLWSARDARVVLS